MVDRKNYHLFQPLLYQVALAVLSPAEIAQPIRSMLRNHPNVEVLMDEAVGFDLAQRRVQLKTGAELEYDYLMSGDGVDALVLRERRLGEAGSGIEDGGGCDGDSAAGAAGV